MSARVKFSDNSSGNSATAQINADSTWHKLDQLVSANAIASGKVNQVEVLDGGSGVKLTVWIDGQEWTATAPGFGNNVVNVPSISVSSLWIKLDRQ